MQAQATYQSYYTKSQPLVDYMVKMPGTQPGMRVLEPCAGDGAFIDALIHEEANLFLEAYEMNPAAIAILRKKYKDRKNICITHADTLVDDQLTFLANAGGMYDRIIANPPYGAWQDFEKRKGLKHMYTELYVKETYTLFLLRCIQLLNDGGRLVFIIPDTFLNLHRHTNLRKFLLTNTRIEEIVLFPTKFFPQVNFGYSNLSIITLERRYGKDNCLDNQFSVLTGFKKVEDLANRAKCEKAYTFVQKDIYAHPHHAFFVSDFSVTMHLNSPTQTIGDIADCVTGIYSGNDKKYLHSINPSANNSANYIKKIPFILPSNDLLETVNSLVTELLVILKRDRTVKTENERMIHNLFKELYGF